METTNKPRRTLSGHGEQMTLDPFEIVSQPINTHYICNVNEEFVHVKQFEDLVFILDTAKKGDFVDIKLSTEGGALHAVIPVINAIRNTQAHVHVHVVSDVASAGTFFLMEANSVFVNDYVTTMLHNVNFGAVGTGSHVEDQVKHVAESSKVLLRQMYKYFLTENEIEQLLNGKEFYFTPEQVHTRLAKREQMREKEAKAEGNETAKKAPKTRKAKKPVIQPED